LNIQLTEETGFTKPVSSTDVIIILDESGSMSVMGDEPVQSVNVFIEEQKSNSKDDNATFTLVTFNNKSKVVIDHYPLTRVPLVLEKDYKPNSGTALNDTVCSVLKVELSGNNPMNKVVVIVTDGLDNSSQKYTTSDLREYINNAEKNYGWKFVFLGANINVSGESANINISQERCAQFDPSIPGDLVLLSRPTSIDINNYRRRTKLSDGNVDLLLYRSHSVQYNNTRSPVNYTQIPYGTVPIPYELEPIIIPSKMSHTPLYLFP